jgi:hypothetical protein
MQILFIVVNSVVGVNSCMRGSSCHDWSTGATVAERLLSELANCVATREIAETVCSSVKLDWSTEFPLTPCQATLLLT